MIQKSLQNIVFLQGNGHERDFTGDDRVYILDAYNNHIYPGDMVAKRKCFYMHIFHQAKKAFKVTDQFS